MTSKSEPTSAVTFAKALADPTRQKIMGLVCCEWLSVSKIVEAVGVRQSTVSHHLAVLRNAGLVSARTKGKHTYYSLNQACVVMCCGNLIETFAPETDAAKVIMKTVKEI